MSIISVTPQQARPLAKDHLRLPTPPPLYHVDVNSEFDGRSQPIVVTNKEAVKQKMLNLLSVIAGEEQFEPLWGSLLPFRVFENMGPGTEGLMEFDSIDAVTKFMSGDVQVLHGDAEVTPLDNEDGYFINLPFVLKKTGQLDSLRFRLLRPR